MQVDKSLSRNNEGSGIGLTIAKILVKLHEGTIKAISTEEKGSEFIVEIPVRIIEDGVIYDTGKKMQDTDEKIRIELSDIYLKD